MNTIYHSLQKSQKGGKCTKRRQSARLFKNQKHRKTNDLNTDAQSTDRKVKLSTRRRSKCSDDAQRERDRCARDACITQQVQTYSRESHGGRTWCWLARERDVARRR